MKIKSIIKLICFVLVLAFCGVWAFNGITIFTSKFQRPDSVMSKDSTLGAKYVAYYTIGANTEVVADDDTTTELTEDELTEDEVTEDEVTEDEVTDEAETDDEAVETVELEEAASASGTDVAEITANAVKVFQKRAKAIGYNGVRITMVNNDLVRVELPGTSSTSGLEDFFENTGKLEITNDDVVIFTNDDIKSAKVIGYDSDAQLFYAQLNLKGEAKDRLKSLTSNGAYSFSVNMDDVVSVTYSGSDTVKNGKMLIGFSTSTYSDALTLVYCVNSGIIDGTITAETDMGKIVTATAGDKTEVAFGFALLGLFVIAAVYFIVSKKLLGVAATLSAVSAIILMDFYGATFSWLQVGTFGLLGLTFGILLSLIALALVLNSINNKYLAGRNALDAIDLGIADMRGVILELCGILLAGGIGLWICGGGLRDFGVGVFGGAFVAAFVSLVLLKFIIRIFVGLGAEAKALGLKRGE